MPRNYIPRPKLWTDSSIQRGIEEINLGSSIQATAKKYHVSFFMMRKRFLASKGELVLKKRGRSTRLSRELEERLAGYIRRMADCGFGPTIVEFKEIVTDYLTANELNNVFKDNKPGDDWVRLFMQRHKLSLKKAGLMQIARKNVTSDSFVIYGFYDMLEAEVERLGITNRPECFWNLDESGFPTDPSKWKTIGPIGAKTIRVSCGANRENTTVMACCCANGSAMDPLIIFKGKNVMSNWRGDEALEKTSYAVSDSGWMTTQIFYDWFQQFCIDTKHIRPLLLVFDGHLSHTSASVIELAQKENVSILKLPAHCTDTLQPLDVACFSPLKTYYEDYLTRRVHETGAREPLKKASFVNLISKIWRKGMSSKNIASGFRTTGIFPVNHKKYKETRLDKVKMASYEKWVEAGKPKDHNNEPLALPPPPAPDPLASPLSDVMPHKSPSTSCDSPITPFASPSTPITSPNTSFSGRIDNYTDTVKKLQAFAPPGCKYVVSVVPKEDEVTFEAVIKSRGRPSTAGSQPAKRQRISMHSSILTDQDFKKQQDEIKRPTAKKKIPNRPEASTSDDSSSSSDESLVSNELSDVESDTNFDKEVNKALCRKRIANAMPNPDAVKVKEFYAVRYDKPLKYYWGQILKLFSDDEGVPDDKAEVKFLAEVEMSSNALLRRWDWPKDDIEVVEINCFIAGPSTPIVEGKSRRGGSVLRFEEDILASEHMKGMKSCGVPSPAKKK